jgi:polyisoprenoid-binding protein YceI
MKQRTTIAATVIVLASAAPLGWTLLSDGAPAPVSLEAMASAPAPVDAAPAPILVTDSDRLPAPPPFDQSGTGGRWSVVPGPEVFVGYRVEERMVGNLYDSTAGGRAPGVSGRIDVEGETINSIVVDVDMTTMASDKPLRDRYLRNAGLRTNDFPTARFEVSNPFAVPLLDDGFDVPASVTGSLTLVGSTTEVVADVLVRRDGDDLLIVGTVTLNLADAGVDAPTNPFVTVNPVGTIEFQLRFRR